MLERQAEGAYVAVQHDPYFEGHTCHAFRFSKAYPDVSYPAGRRSSCAEAPQRLIVSPGASRPAARDKPYQGRARSPDAEVSKPDDC
jgi:hypothetical protein